MGRDGEGLDGREEGVWGFGGRMVGVEGRGWDGGGGGGFRGRMGFGYFLEGGRK